MTPLPAALERLRRDHVANALQGVPAHVTLLYPFVRPDRLTPDIRAVLAAVCRAASPFEFELASARTRASIAYLAPRPARPLVRLISSLAMAFPDYPRYGGAYEEILPHVTIAESGQRTLLEAVRARCAPHLPVHMAARTVVLLIEGQDGRWRGGWRLPLGR